MANELDDWELVEDDWEVKASPSPQLAYSPLPEGWQAPVDQVDPIQRENEMRASFGDPGTSFTQALARSTGLFAEPKSPQRLEEEKRIAAFREQAGVEEIPAGLKAATALSSGFTKAANLPQKVIESLNDITGLSRVMDAIGMPGPEGGWQSNTERALQQITEQERQMAAADEAITEGGAGYQILEGTARGLAELPAQLLPGMAARNTAQAIRIAAGTAGALGGAQQFSQSRGQGQTTLQALPRAVLSGMITAMTTKAFGATGAESLLRASGPAALKAKLKDVIKQAGWEATEESIDQLGQDILERHAENPGKPLSDTVKDVLIAGAVGGLVGGIVTGGRSALPSSRQDGRVRKSEVDRPKDLSGIRLNEAPPSISKAAEEFHQLQQMEQEGKLDVESARRLEDLKTISESGMTIEDLDYLEQERQGMRLESAISTGSNPDDPFTGRVMQANFNTGKVEINPYELALQMKGMNPDQRKAYIKSALSEEKIHLSTPQEAADKFIKNATGVEKFLAGWRYTGNISGRPEAGAAISQRNLGHEMLRSQIQRMQGITRTELAASVKSGKLTTKVLLATEDAIFDIRKALGTSASKEQLAALDQVEKNVKEGLRIAAEGGTGDEGPSAMRISGNASPAINDFAQKFMRGPEEGFKMTNADTQKTGLELMGVEDLDALLSMRRAAVEERNKLKAEAQRLIDAGDRDAGMKAMNRMAAVGPKTQYIREVIEMATNLGSWQEGARNKFGPRPLDAASNPEVRKWLEQHGDEVGVRISEPRPAAIRRGGPSKRGQEIAEQKRRIAEMQAKARGEELPPELQTKVAPQGAPVPAEERVSAEQAGALPRISGKDLEARAATVLQGEINIPQEKRPTFDEFATWARRNMEGVRPEQLRDMWEDRVWGALLRAEPQRLESWRKALGLESKYGTRPIVPIAPEEGFGLEVQGDKILARQDKLAAEARQRYRNKIIGAIARRLIGESVEGRASLNRNTVGIDDIAFDNEKTQAGPYAEINRDDIADPKRLNAILRDQARGSSSDPESASRRLLAVVDSAGKVHLLTTYNDAGVQRVTDPGGTALRSKPSRELNKTFLNQYRPFASILLTDPVKGLRQMFQSMSEFNDKIGKEASERARIGDWEIVPEGPAPEDFEAEGTPGLEGEGGSFMGPAKQTVVSGARPGEMESDVPLTEPEIDTVLNHIMDETGGFDAPDDVRLSLDGLVAAAAADRLTPSDRMAINGYRKVFDAIEATNPNLSREEILDRMADQIYETYKFSETAAEFVKKSMAQFAPQSARPAGPQPQEGGAVGEMAGGRAQYEYIPKGSLETQPPIAEETDEERAAQEQFIARRSQALPADRPLSEMSSREAEQRANIEALEAGGAQLSEAQRRQGIQTARQRVRRKQGILPTYEQAQQIYDENFPEEGELPAAIRRRVGPTITNLIRDFGSIYDSWMVDRIERHGGPVAAEAAEAFRAIIDREKQFYGELTPSLDKARRLAGATSRVPIVGQVPTPAGIKALNWLNQLDPIKGVPFAANSRTVGAIERTVRVPVLAQDVVDAARQANLEIGLMMQMVVPGFRAGNKFERNVTPLGYDVIRQGSGDMWTKWTAALARANKLPISKVRRFFTDWKRVMDSPESDAAAIESVKQDFARKFTNAVTHIKQDGRWQAVLHADLFNYLENAARRATHARAFRAVWPHSAVGRQDLAEVMADLRKELAPAYQKDLNALILTMQGHPTDDYSSMGGFAPTEPMGRTLKLFNQTIGNLFARMALTGQMFVQPGEVIAGSTPVFLGYRNYLKGMAQLKQIYPELERAGMVNRVIHDFSYDPKSPVRSAFKIAGNTLSKGFAEQALNELQEAGAAATARVVADNITSNNLSDWEKRMLPRTFEAMGFNSDEVMGLMQGDPALLGQFQRKAAAFLTSGNRAISEGSRLGANRLFNSVFRFQSYPMTKLNQLRRVTGALAEAWQEGTPYQKRTATEQFARFMFGNAAQGALTVAITSLAFGGMQGLKIKWEEAKDEPLEFLTESFLATMSGPMYIVWRGLNAKGILGVGENATRAAFPYTVMTDLIDFAQGAGKYRNLSTFGKIGKFLSAKTPGTKAITTGMALFGLGLNDQKLDVSIDAFYRWRREELGFSEHRSFGTEDERKSFREKMKRAVEAMKDGDEEKFYEAYQEAADELLTMEKGATMAEAFDNAKILKGATGADLTDEQKDSLIERIGEDAYNRLEYFDLMLEEAGKGVLLPKFDE